ncbi:MAG: sugar ABC transporter ATP-binding protein [Leptolinea sp.]|jgi:ribose transport system ATP-binding protein/rhamnose transport system ATP-binding protein|nr:sugar ABC transporter ATP-binding protein [Leptolinea sp.]
MDLRLKVSRLSKAFPGVQALDNVGLEIKPGEIHALVGENGAGKSTLMHVIDGVYRPDSGEMTLDGEPYAPVDEKAAQNSGVAMVFQEGSLFPPLSVAENIFAGRQPIKSAGIIDFDRMNQESSQILEKLESPVKPTDLVEFLSPGQRQMVDIAKALSQNVRLLILDEPTSSLTINEARQLFKVLRQLRERGVSIIYVTHRLSEVFEISDRVTVLKDGKISGTRVIAETNQDDLIHLEVGRELSSENTTAVPAANAPVVLEIQGLAAKPVKNVSLTVRAGEIVCLAGLVGAGRTELCEAIFGVRKIESGKILLGGKEIHPTHPSEAIREDICMVPEERREAGLFVEMSLAANIAAANLNQVSRMGIVDEKRVNRLATEYKESLHIATPDIQKLVMLLSGGNQQKVLLGKWLARKPRLLIVDEPTRGVDVGAKAEIYHILRGLAREGIALLVVSSDLPEVLTLSNRIIVMSEGYSVGELDAKTTDEVTILQMATPRSREHALIH